MDLIIRDPGEQDFDAVLSLNQSQVPHVGSINMKTMRWYASNADYFQVALLADQLAAFLVGFLPGSSYGSPNYRWFCDRFDSFAYIDRIAVAEFARRQGLATMLYADFAAALPESIQTLTCEVNLQPPNESSMSYHRRLGFEQVGSLDSAGGDKKVAMLARNLPLV
jgi:uncharacterized protein